MDCKGLKASVAEFRQMGYKIINKVDDVTIAAEIWSLISSSLGGETFSSISDTHPRDQIITNIDTRYEKAVEDLWTVEFDDIAKERVFGKKFARSNTKLDEDLYFEPDRFIKAIEKLNRNGIPVYLTNYKIYSDDVWAEYKRLLLRNPERKKKYLKIIKRV